MNGCDRFERKRRHDWKFLLTPQLDRAVSAGARTN
jgi:hypothetical protein